MSNPSEAARFKAEGNALFQKNQFGAAYVLYTQAIKHDSQNAILYCNRAACSLGLSRYCSTSSYLINMTLTLCSQIPRRVHRCYAGECTMTIIGHVKVLITPQATKIDSTYAKAWARLAAASAVSWLFLS